MAYALEDNAVTVNAATRCTAITVKEETFIEESLDIKTQATNSDKSAHSIKAVTKTSVTAGTLFYTLTTRLLNS